MKIITFTHIIKLATFKELPVDKRRIIRNARKAIKYSHSIYSNFQVGCSIRLKSGLYLNGSNQENAAYGSTICAERSTIMSAFNHGYHRDIIELAVTAKPAGIENYVGTHPVGPCGACLQVMLEAEQLSGMPMSILLDCFNDEKIYHIRGLDSLLTLPFGPYNLGIDLSKPISSSKKSNK